jgi:hypothetical protein
VESSTGVLSGTVTFAIGLQAKIGVLPLHGGHHAMWSSPFYQADICNMADDWVVVDQETGVLYRFPIVDSLVPWSRMLIAAMDEYDAMSNNPWAQGNADVRALTLDAAIRNRGDRHVLNVFNPGFVTPAVASDDGPTVVDRLLAQIIAENPDAVVGE